MDKRRNTCRRRRHPRSLLGYLLPMSAIMLIGIMLAAALAPQAAQTNTSENLQVERLADQLAGSITSASSLPVPAQKEDSSSAVFPDWIVQDFLPINNYSRPGTKLDGVTGVVVHYTGNPGTTAEQNRSYFGNLAETHETYASSHFVIGMDGAIIQCVPLDEVAYCSSHRNNDTISIECCHMDESGQFSQETLESLTQLLNWLIETYQLNRNDILRHYDVTGKECPRYYVKYPDAWTELLNNLVF